MRPGLQACLEMAHTKKVGLVHDTDKVLQLQSQETVTCYGSQRPTKASGCSAEENWCQVKCSGVEKHSKTLVHIIKV